MRVNKIFCAVAFLMLVLNVAMAVDLTGTSYVSITSDTAATAKDKAFNSACRDVISRELRHYANPEQLDRALKDSTNEELMNIISSSSLGGEKVSDTTYSANISFVIDGNAAISWMEKYSVQNWLPKSGVAVVVPENSVMINATLLQSMTSWMSLNAIARAVSVDLATKKLVGNVVSFTVLDKDIAKFTSALRSNGWNVQHVENGLKIWK